MYTTFFCLDDAYPFSVYFKQNVITFFFKFYIFFIPLLHAITPKLLIALSNPQQHFTIYTLRLEKFNKTHNCGHYNESRNVENVECIEYSTR